MVVSANGINIPHACTPSLSAYNKHVTLQQLRSFLDMVSFYHAFLPSTATHTKSLPAATSESLSPNNVSWSSLVISDFNHILSLIANHLSLIMPIGMSCLLLGVGGVLFVCRDGADLPVPYFSRQTKLHEEKYSATELECPVIVESFKHFRVYLIGTHLFLHQ